MGKIHQNNQTIVINHIFDNYIDFDNYLLSNNNECNGVTENFLKEHYHGDVMKWYQDNTTNKGCFNCKNCKMCVNCVECIDCEYCAECSNINGIEELISMISSNKKKYDI